MFARSKLDGSLAGVGLEHLVAARTEVQAERPADLWLVVDHQDAVSRALLTGSSSGMAMITVNPPPGVSSSSSLPCMACTNPWAIDIPSPTPSADRSSPSC